jgi:hypothetical protein
VHALRMLELTRARAPGTQVLQQPAYKATTIEQAQFKKGDLAEGALRLAPPCKIRCIYIIHIAYLTGRVCRASQCVDKVYSASGVEWEAKGVGECPHMHPLRSHHRPIRISYTFQ